MVRRVLPALLAAVLAGGCNVYARGWSAVHADAGNTDYSRVRGAADVTLAWQRSLGGTINLGGTISPEGRVHVTSTSGGCHLYVLDGATGATIWCSDEVDQFAVASSPLLDKDGRIFVADSEAMHAFDRDGNVMWETPIEGVPLSAQFTPNGRLLFITHIGIVYVLRRGDGAHVLPPVELVPGATFDPADGMTACMTGTPECPSANTPAVDLATGRVFFTFWEPGSPHAGVRAVRVTEDPAPAVTPLWSNDSFPGGSASSPALSADGSRLYVTDNSGNMHALDAATGDTIWTYSLGFASAGSASVSPDGVIMPAGGGASPLLALQDEGDHARLRWRKDALLNRGIATQAAGGKVYATVNVGTRLHDLVVLDTATGAELDRERLPGTTFFTVGTTIGSTKMVYVPTFVGQLFAFRPA